MTDAPMPELVGVLCQHSPATDISHDVLPRLLTAARRHLGMEVAFISEFTSGQRVFRHVDSPGDDRVQVGGADPLEDSYCQRVVDGRFPRLITDARKLAAAQELPSTFAFPVGAHLSVPIVLRSGEVYGTFCCFSTRADPSLHQRDLDVIQMFAEVASQYIDDELAAARQNELVRGRVAAFLAGTEGLRTVFQPIVGVADSQLHGVEALTRFPGAPYRTPDLWFADADTVGLGVELEIYAMRRAVQHLSVLPTSAYLALNVSPAAVMSGLVQEALGDTDPGRIVLEMTEHAPIPDYDALNAALGPLRQRGVRVAVDDAGAGYASLRHILALQPELIKLDISITRDLDSDPARLALASALVGFAADIGSSIIAEGVETEPELQALQALGAAAAQGYHLGRPGELAESLAHAAA